jgi:ATP-dependent helicase HrpA
VTLYGVPIVARRRVDYGRIEPGPAREMLIRHALVEGDWQTHHRFFHENATLIGDVQALEDRARRRDLLVDDDAIFAFYGERVPAHVTSVRHFDSWWKVERTRHPDLLSLTPDLLISPGAGRIRFSDFPDFWQQGDLELALSYLFDPMADDDGVTVHIPIAVLNRVEPDGFDWHIPGLRAELVTALIRLLPKPVRRAFVPVPDYAAAFLEQAAPADGPLLACLSDVLGHLTGELLPLGIWAIEQLPPHLRITFRIVDEAGRIIASGKDLESLKRWQRERIREGIGAAARAYERSGLRSWTVGTVPRVVEVPWQGHLVEAYPALVDEHETVALRMLPSAAEQERAMWAGTRRLLLLSVPSSPAKALARVMTNETKLALARLGQATVATLLDDCVSCGLDALMAEHGGPAWDEEGFLALVDVVKADLGRVAGDVAKTVGRILVVAAAIGARLSTMTAPPLAPSVGDARSHLARLVHRGFVTATGARRLPDVLRYLQALERRLEKLPDAPARDAEITQRVQHLEERYQRVRRLLPPDVPPALAADADHVHWMLEELRVSLYAQTVGTAFPVSEKRVLRKLEELAAG